MESQNSAEGPDHPPPILCTRVDVDLFRAEASEAMQRKFKDRYRKVLEDVGADYLERVGMSRVIGDRMKALTREGFDALDGVLRKHRARDKDMRHYLSELSQWSGFDALPSEVKEIFKRLSILDSKSTDPLTITDVILALRLAYPEGKNVINRTWNLERGPISLDAAKHCTIACGGITIEVHPRGGVSVVRSSEGGTCTLPEGGEVLIGRPLFFTTILGLKTKSTFGITPDLVINKQSFSRAAILLQRKKGRILVLDKASRNPITVTQDDLISDYDPDVKNPDGSFGKSEQKSSFMGHD